MNDAAGDTAFKTCPGCSKTVKVYTRSFSGVGKKCPSCEVVFGPDGKGGVRVI